MSTGSKAGDMAGDEPLALAFDSVEQAEHVRSRLMEAGVGEDRVRLHHGAGDQDFGPGTSGPQDDEVAASMFVKGGVGMLLGTLLGGTLAAAIAAAFTQPFAPAWWGATIGGGFAGLGVGLLWGFMGGFTGRSRRTRSGGPRRQSSPSEDVTVSVEPVDAQERALTQRILDEAGGHEPPPRFRG